MSSVACCLSLLALTTQACAQGTQKAQVPAIPSDLHYVPQRPLHAFQCQVTAILGLEEAVAVDDAGVAQLMHHLSLMLQL